MGHIEQNIERQKAILDYVKQLTALSTGSILVVAAFVEKVFPVAHWKWLTATSIVGFIASILGSIIAHTIFVIDFPPRLGEQPNWEGEVGGFSLVVAWTGFLLGIISLAVFTTKNLVR